MPTLLQKVRILLSTCLILIILSAVLDLVKRKPHWRCEGLKCRSDADCGTRCVCTLLDPGKLGTCKPKK